MKPTSATKHIIVLGIVMGILMAASLSFYSLYLKRSMQNEVKETLRAVSEQNVYYLSAEIDSNFHLLNEITKRFDNNQALNRINIVESLSAAREMYGFKRMGIIMPDGTAYTTDHLTLDLSERQYFKDGMQGHASVTGILSDIAGNAPINVYSTPIYQQGQPAAVLFATFSNESFRLLMSVPSFEGKGYIYLIDQNGDIIVDPSSDQHYRGVNMFNGFLSSSDRNQNIASKLQTAIQDGQSGYFKFHYMSDKYMYYSPLGINDWYLLTIVPTDIFDHPISTMITLTYILCFSISILFILGIIALIRNQARSQKDLIELAYFDPLTSGYSYAKFKLEAQKTIKTEVSQAACVFMDIDKFRIINELYGMEKGDEVIRTVWSLWNDFIREHEVFCHQIADRFTALLLYQDLEDLDLRIQNLCRQLRDIVISGDLPHLYPSAGIYLIQPGDTSIDTACDNAAMANRTIKGRQDCLYAYYSTELKNQLIKNRLIEEQMESALENGEFVVYYQPKVDTQTCLLMGAEALVRWKKPDGTIIAPGEFIPLFESNGFILTLDKYIFLSVCAQQKAWKEQGISIVPVSVNLSRFHLYNSSFLESMMEYFGRYDLSSKYIQLEITESAMMENQGIMQTMVDQLHQQGFSILMDDFGTGYSSMLLLKNLYIDTLKLDKSFIDETGNPRGEKILESILDLAKSLNIETTAEGVETRAQYEFLKKLGCSNIQGYYFAKPMPSEKFVQLLKKQEPFK